MAARRPRLAPVPSALAASMVALSCTVPAWGAPPIELQKLLAADGDTGDELGVAAALSGDLLLIGARGHDERGVDAGVAHVFRRQGDVWVEEQKLLAADAAERDEFGAAVALSGDVALVGAHGHDEAAEDAGAVFVFRRQGAGWVQEAKLVADDAEPAERFGVSVAVDGVVAVIGADTDDERGPFAGAAYVFRYESGSWTQEAKLLAPDGEAGDRFGFATAVSGNLAIVGAYGEDERGPSAGAAYLFRKWRDTWALEQKLLPLDGETNDQFGVSVAVSGDVALVGAYLEDERGPGAGAAYVFRGGGGGWMQEQKLLAEQGESGDRFGFSVAVGGDVALVGAYGEDERGSSAGAAYLFRRTGKVWLQQKIVAADGQENDWFGSSVALSGAFALVGACFEDERALDAGAAYVGSIESCPADVNGDGVVDIADLVFVLDMWGECE